MFYFVGEIDDFSRRNETTVGTKPAVRIRSARGKLITYVITRMKTSEQRY